MFLPNEFTIFRTTLRRQLEIQSYSSLMDMRRMSYENPVKTIPLWHVYRHTAAINFSCWTSRLWLLSTRFMCKKPRGISVTTLRGLAGSETATPGSENAVGGAEDVAPRGEDAAAGSKDAVARTEDAGPDYEIGATRTENT
ncbi:hypothetical protein PR048_026165 [Dryococelus australis]|uniref:Uncharacterized protein n=1 Tax=Dryococelus australis TaxID=614101 RepID=A0ABQ9GKM0_9NEOP|nr:hypothetical protein PR048_026165 [Dryococelus australis]